MMEKWDLRIIANVSGGIIKLALFPGGKTEKDPAIGRKRVAAIGGYAIYDDKGGYIAGFATGYMDEDLKNAQEYVIKYNEANPINPISAEVINKLF